MMNSSVEHIKNLDQTLGIIIRANHNGDGIEFFTPDMFSQQLAYMNHPQGYVIQPHVHNPVQRDVLWTQEVLIIKSGKVRIDFYTEGQHYLESRIVGAGDVVLLAAGGHGFEMLEPTEMIEVKQGPYCGDQDKTRFESLRSDEIRVAAA
jgi:mannose-6-phosphate isomerase-like protein (cupin superfamily)